MKNFPNIPRRVWIRKNPCFSGQRQYRSGTNRLAKIFRHYTTFARTVTSQVRSAIRTCPEIIGAYGRVVSRDTNDELFGIFATVLLTFIPMVAVAQSKAEHDISVYAIGNYTTRSLGEFNNHAEIFQSNKAVLGAAGYFESWKHNNGLVLGGSYTNTDSQLMNLRFTVVDTWKLQRYKADALYEHRFRIGKDFQPYLGLGAFIIVLWGGYAPAHSGVNASGLDSLRGFIVPVGLTIQLHSRLSLKTGLFVDIGKASTYGDTTYKSSQNLMYEPQIGLSFKLGAIKNPVG